MWGVSQFYKEQSDLSLHCLHIQYGQKNWCENFRTITICFGKPTLSQFFKTLAMGSV